jgi:hypothetical protein
MALLSEQSRVINSSFVCHCVFVCELALCSVKLQANGSLAQSPPAPATVYTLWLLTSVIFQSVACNIKKTTTGPVLSDACSVATALQQCPINPSGLVNSVGFYVGVFESLR